MRARFSEILANTKMLRICKFHYRYDADDDDAGEEKEKEVKKWVCKK